MGAGPNVPEEGWTALPRIRHSPPTALTVDRPQVISSPLTMKGKPLTGRRGRGEARAEAAPWICDDPVRPITSTLSPRKLQESYRSVCREYPVLSLQAADGNDCRDGSDLLRGEEKKHQEEPATSNHFHRLRRALSCPPHGLLGKLITNLAMAVLLWAVGWSITTRECLPGGNLFGILMIFYGAVIGGKLLGFVHLPALPPLPALLGMLLAGFLLRNVPLLSENLRVAPQWSSALRSMALAIILVRAGLGLDSRALRKLKGVCLRLSMGPCLVEACTAALLSHLLLALPWPWAFLLGFVLGAVSPAVVVPSMLLLQGGGFGVEKGVPTLLMAAGSFDDILAITGFNTCLGIVFSTGSTVFNVLRGALEIALGLAVGSILGLLLRYFPSHDQGQLPCRRAFLVLGLSVLAVFSSVRSGFPGSGGLCSLVLAFLAGRGWASQKADVEKIVAVFWEVFQPLLFGLIGSEVSITSLRPETVGLCVAILSIALLIRILTTFLMVCFAGFNLKEKIFISFAWLPKATVQAAIGSVALDTARAHGEAQLEKFGMDVLTAAFLAILLTAPIGSLLIGLLGPRLLRRADLPDEDGQLLPALVPVERLKGCELSYHYPITSSSAIGHLCPTVWGGSTGQGRGGSAQDREPARPGLRSPGAPTRPAPRADEEAEPAGSCSVRRAPGGPARARPLRRAGGLRAPERPTPPPEAVPPRPAPPSVRASPPGPPSSRRLRRRGAAPERGRGRMRARPAAARRPAHAQRSPERSREGLRRRRLARPAGSGEQPGRPPRLGLALPSPRPRPLAASRPAQPPATPPCHPRAAQSAPSAPPKPAPPSSAPRRRREPPCARARARSAVVPARRGGTERSPRGPGASPASSRPAVPALGFQQALWTDWCGSWSPNERPTVAHAHAHTPISTPTSDARSEDDARRTTDTRPSHALVATRHAALLGDTWARKVAAAGQGQLSLESESWPTHVDSYVLSPLSRPTCVRGLCPSTTKPTEQTT
ncbi:sodium/hydrogen exchanger 9B2-like [Suncus etruscus]|uniref:sodium/hydrogen exchanger 9B2-like n=1 Tax=Suncus etruscus TaxID=109475 RepID=UPI002110E235|nr:sodium/hydrogen exchanger 9B2-like [Suncus etruscus]